MDDIVHRAKKIMKAIDISPKQRKQTNKTATAGENRIITKTTNNNDNKIEIEAKTTTIRLKEENKTLRVEINKLRNEIKLKDNTIEELKENLSAADNSNLTNDERVIQLQQRLARSEAERQSLAKENSISRSLIHSQKQLIERLENESSRISQLYSKLANSQRKLISLLEAKYNELLHSLIDSFDDIDSGASYETKVEEIQSDLNNLIQVLGHRLVKETTTTITTTNNNVSGTSGDANEIRSRSSSFSIEQALSEQALGYSGYSPNSIQSMRRLLSEHLLAIESGSDSSSYSDVSWTQNYEESMYIDFDFNYNQSLKSIDSKDRSTLNSFESSTILSKSDFECQCQLLEDQDKTKTNAIIEANKTLMTQLEHKSSEVDELRAQIEQMRSVPATKEPPAKHDKSVVPIPISTQLNSECDSLQDLIANYMGLIKSYKQLVRQLDQAKMDNSQLRSSYNSLNEKYLILKSASTTTTHSDV